MIHAPMSKDQKIFCIGLNKTGTTTLHEAFLILGVSSVHYECDAGNIKEIIYCALLLHKKVANSRREKNTWCSLWVDPEGASFRCEEGKIKSIMLRDEGKKR